MHELAFAEEVLKLVEIEACNHNAKRVLSIRLEVGQLSGLDRRSLTFCLEAITSGTRLEGASIEAVDAEPSFFCPTCGSFPVEGTREPVCPLCGEEAKMSPGTEITLKEIELDVEDD